MKLELIKNPSFAERTTLGLGGTAEVEIVVRDTRDLDGLGMFLMSNPLRPFVIGEGSNILASDGHHDMALIRTATMPGPERVEKQGKQLIVHCGAGQRLPGLLGWAQMAGLSGLEGLTGIPGSVGGSVAMNAGSYGMEIGDAITRVRLWTPSAGLHWVDAKECIFGYRHFSCGPEASKALIWEVEFSLTESSPKEVRATMKDFYIRKKSTQPVTTRSAGCVFKNPEEKAAGLLLDEAGMKGVSIGGMAFSKMHANFLINLGTGNASDALELVEAGRTAVKTQFGITLETEVIVL
ncbi:UDP-N-acetylmuramate dehydrogenase [Pseudodesulfovibrio piezophilus]|uniref:UDP-N-acetylenolpyruvoylglucosamine reductase n=1 Tax=Pseudodesulfovibrio piezophilus (strain DSM 21447 / JCM 15486 / C1TLV30) TaxID=1322246 RepID=M1WSD9_PSEP2|nr:UDP-N-acetylmuramate dehydrogenase [Pseudodesulfovibrio piezophilus]CCH48837.1 UDP-N-acetylenolpyruvoylglucosamine reductase [Pseudodesulfovibrio piezophilus C1TLV30]